VYRHLENLVSAHMSNFFPGRQMKLRPIRQKPGPKGLKNKNPFPAHSSDQVVNAVWLKHDYEVLRSAFRERLNTSADKPVLKAALVEWYQTLANEILAKTSSEEGVASWSDRKDYITIKASPSELASVPESSSDPWNNPITEWLEIEWTPLDLHSAIKRMLIRGGMGAAGKNGKPAYLAYAVLGALVNQTPEKIRNTIDNHQYRRRFKKTR